VRKLVRGVRGAENFFVLKYRLAGEKIVEQSLTALVVENGSVEIDVRR